MLHKYGKRTCEFLGRYYLFFSYVFFILRAILIAQSFPNFQTCSCWENDLKNNKHNSLCLG